MPLTDRPYLVLSVLIGSLLFLVLSSQHVSLNAHSSDEAESLRTESHTWRLSNYLPAFDKTWNDPPKQPSSSTSSTASKAKVFAEPYEVDHAYDHLFGDSVAGSSDPLAYRKHLEATTSPYTYTHHSPTLTFSHIYVVSLPNRQDRRETMSRIASALGIKITFVDAINKDSPLISWVAEQVYTMRKKKLPALSKALGIPENDIGGMGIGSIWLARPGSRGAKGNLELPDARESKFHDMDWVQYMIQAEKNTPPQPSGQEDGGGLLRPSRADFNVSEALYDHLEERPSRQSNAAVLSTWHSHIRAMRLAQENDDESALVLEDDVDIEWNIERMWASVHKRLPQDWEMVFLGHCWGREMTYPTQVHPFLFHSFGPRCLHGYAMSRKGYNHILDLMSEPWSAYQAPVDTAIPTFIRTGDLSPFSLDPALIIQSKDSPSDIQPGTGSLWRGIMMDSTLERIWRDEGKEVPELTFDEAIKDPFVLRPHVQAQT